MVLFVVSGVALFTLLVVALCVAEGFRREAIIQKDRAELLDSKVEAERLLKRCEQARCSALQRQVDDWRKRHHTLDEKYDSLYRDRNGCVRANVEYQQELRKAHKERDDTAATLQAFQSENTRLGDHCREQAKVVVELKERLARISKETDTETTAP